MDRQQPPQVPPRHLYSSPTQPNLGEPEEVAVVSPDRSSVSGFPSDRTPVSSSRGSTKLTKQQVKPFTRESLERLESKTVQLVREYGFQPRRKVSVEDGSVLPYKFEPFPSNLYGRPLEEIDNFIYDEEPQNESNNIQTDSERGKDSREFKVPRKLQSTFCVVSKRFRKNYIHRFTATNSFFIFSPWNSWRRACVFVSTNQYFDYIVMATILLNCVFLALEEQIEEAEYFFLVIYSLEMVIKSVAKGFILNKYTYLRNPWNWLDFVVIASGYATTVKLSENLAGLRTFRVLRALKTVSIMPGLKTIINALLHSFRQLAEVMTLTIFCLMVFALFALQVYMGELRNKCIETMPDGLSNNSILDFSNFTRSEWIQWRDQEWFNWHNNSENWYLDEDRKPVLCGNVTGARHCEKNYVCVQFGENPNYGYTSFDNFLWSMLTTFQLITLDYWEDVYNKVLATCGPISVTFFTVVVFFGSFYLINLMLAVVALSYEEEAEITQEERRKELPDHRDDSTFSFDPSNLDVKTLEKDTEKRKIDARKGILLASYTKKKTRKRKKNNKKKDEKNNDSSKCNSPKESFRDGDAAEVCSTPQRPTALEIPSPHVPSRQPSPHRQQQPSPLPHSANSEARVTEHLHPNAVATYGAVLKELRTVLPAKTASAAPQLQQQPAGNELSVCSRARLKKPGSNSDSNNPESSLDDSGVVDDHEGGDITSEEAPAQLAVRHLRQPAYTTIVRGGTGATETVICNGVSPAQLEEGIYRCGKPDMVIHDKLQDRNCTKCEQCCLNYHGWLRFQNCLYNIVHDPLFDLLITLCIVLNTLFLALEHHGMSESVKAALNIGNKVFTSIFTLECILKITAMSKDYFSCGWNIFDLIVVSASMLDLAFELIDSISVLRGLRLLRVLKLAQSWTTMKVLLSIIISTLGALGNLTFVLVIVIYIFAVIGMQLFSKTYPMAFEDDIPRWNFKDFFHSFMMIFRILCGEWIEPLWDCMRAKEKLKEDTTPCFLIFLPALVMGNFMVLNLFLALLLNSFNSEELKNKKEEEFEEYLRRLKQHRRNFRRFWRELRLLLKNRKRQEVGDDSKLARSVERIKSIFQKRTRSKDLQCGITMAVTAASPACVPVEYLVDEDERPEEGAVGGQMLEQQVKFKYEPLCQQDSKATDSNTEEGIELDEIKSTKSIVRHQESAADASGTEDETKSLDEKIGGRRNSKGQFIDGLGEFPGIGHKKPEKIPQSCFPTNWYERSPCCNTLHEKPVGRWFFSVRKAVLDVVDTPAFEWVVLVMIFASSVTLCFEDIHLDKNPLLKTILYWTNLTFCVLFIIEMLLKWIALGFWRYFTSFWTVLDFIIVFVSVFSIAIEDNENLKVLRSLRTLRALRPLRAISRWQGMRIVVNALMYAIPSIFNVLLVCLVFWLIFSIMGVQFFGGKFYKCVDANNTKLDISIVNHRNDCEINNYTWINSKINFDNVGQGYLALFQVATFEGWMEVMADATDAREIDFQPEKEANIYAYLYFVIFIVCGSFFTLNLFIGVIIDNFNMLKKKYEGGVLEMFLTESQKHYYTAMKKLGRKKPQKVIKRPRNQFLALFYDLSNSRRFEIAIFVLIFLNMLSMGIEHYNQSAPVRFVLEVSNAFFTTVFGLEAIVKIIGLRYHYFTVPWNLFDFILVMASILGIVMEDMMVDLPVSPTLLRVVRVFRIGRILRLIKAAKGIRKLLFALIVSLPALFNIGALLALITFIYAIIGMSLFGHVRQQGALDDMVNFTTFGRSMQLLFRLMTSAGWNDVLDSLMVEPPECDPKKDQLPNGDCGQPFLAITYFVSFIIINYMIVINMYIAIILENFNQAHQEEEIGIVEDDLEMFYIRWSKYDPHATQFIGFSQLSDFISSLDPPLGIAKPNNVALVSFNLPIAKGDKIHCLDILHSLVKHVLGHVEETDDFRKDPNWPIINDLNFLMKKIYIVYPQLREQMDIKFKKQFPTRKELEIISSTRMWKRRDKAAKIIQRAYRHYKRGDEEVVKRKVSSKRRPSFRLSFRRHSKQGRQQDSQREGVDQEDGETQTSSPGGNQHGWRGFSNFLHIRRNSTSYVGSRKSSRASDAGSSVSETHEINTWLGLPLPSQAIFMGARHLIDATSAGTPGIPTVIIMGDETPSVPTTDTGLDEPDDDPLGNFRFSLGELDPDELAATAAANAGFLHPLHNSGDGWRAFSQRVCDSDGEDEFAPHSWTHPLAQSPPDEAAVDVAADVHRPQQEKS
ncbi:sodium channel protein 60E-like isoform X4 [Neocloeon triangulifer]|uniref:sodium channel protein 60E-like isoform X4 n=1 Tax=Neocloeon triangulifer TaxID=2078957 RepID=UPI00286F80F4|nr:sodium channel protein 60E-like isoform X4 [Neocloeon triangulifer]